MNPHSLQRHLAVGPPATADARADMRFHRASAPPRPPSSWTLVKQAAGLVAAMVAGAVAAGVGFEIKESLFSVDADVPHGAVGAYFEALADGDSERASELLCDVRRERLLRGGFAQATRDTVNRGPRNQLPVELGRVEKVLGGHLVTARYSAGGWDRFAVVWEADEQEYRICGFA